MRRIGCIVKFRAVLGWGRGGGQRIVAAAAIAEEEEQGNEFICGLVEL